MKATITVSMDNAAFEDGNSDYELARILKTLAQKIENGEVDFRFKTKLLDINGNTVGHAFIKE